MIIEIIIFGLIILGLGLTWYGMCMYGVERPWGKNLINEHDNADDFVGDL